MLDNLYENIGGKIKNWAKWIFIVESICAIIAGLVLFSEAEYDEIFILYGFLAIILGPVVAWVGSWLLYAFGEMVEDLHAIRKKESPPIKTTQPQLIQTQDKPKQAQKPQKVEQKTAISHNQEVKETVVVPVQIKNGKYECPRCGCSVKNGQEKCLCFSVLDWSEL